MILDLTDSRRSSLQPKGPPKRAADLQSISSGHCLRVLAESFVDGRLSDEALSRMTDDEVEATLTEVPGIGPWTARVPARGSRSAGRLSLGRPRAPARDPTRVRLRPPSDRRSGSGVGSLAAVSEPCSELPVRVRIQGQP
jgi:hypothetical protein